MLILIILINLFLATLVIFFVFVSFHVAVYLAFFYDSRLPMLRYMNIPLLGIWCMTCFVQIHYFL